MKFLTKAQIIQKALDGVVQQGSLSKKGAACNYWSNGLACGVGQLIPLELRNPEFDTPGDTGVLRMLKYEDFRSALLAGGIDTSDWDIIQLLCDIQRFHDSAETVDEFKSKMEVMLSELGHEE